MYIIDSRKTNKLIFCNTEFHVFTIIRQQLLLDDRENVKFRVAIN